MMDWAAFEIGIAAAGLVAFALAFLLWCTCRVSGRISRTEEQHPHLFEKGDKHEKGY